MGGWVKNVDQASLVWSGGRKINEWFGGGEKAKKVQRVG